MTARWIEANAGTGKTFRLTEEIVDSFRLGVSYERICAVTFTEKAANEMVERIRARVVEMIQNRQAPATALDRLNESFIGTIHAFCNRILRRYGNRLGLPPLFAVDSDGSVFQSLLDDRWDRFISGCLRKRGDHEVFIRNFGLPTLRGMVEKLAQRRHEFRPIESADLSWLIHDLRDAGKWNLGNNGWVRLVHEALGSFQQNRDLIQIILENYFVQDPIPWKNAVLDLIRCRHHEFHSCLSWLKRDFVTALLSEYRAIGYLRFDDMILDTHEILKNDFEVRQEMKSRYDRVLVDELQDTDPVQYEIFLFLCEKNSANKDFTLREVREGSRKLELEPGKFFGVGDPKQSIYGFRSADIGAYHAVKELLGQANLVVEPLTENFRSCRNLVRFSNRLAAKCFAAADPQDSQPMKDYCGDKTLSDCVRLVEVRSAHAAEQHLRILTEANWLAAKVQDMITGPEAKRKPQQICILLRKLTSAHLYVDALNSKNIRVVIEGERFFYQSQEVIDFVNLLKYIVDEMDDVALAGILRSPLFGLRDSELAAFFREYREPGAGAETALSAVLQDSDEAKPAVTGLLRTLSGIRTGLRDFTPSKLVDEVFRTLPVLTLAGLAYGSSRKELAPLNLLKIQKLAREADADPDLTAYRFVRTLEAHSREQKRAGQEPMADEALPAVRMMSIHQSKGLDFPVVFVPLTDYGIGGYEDASVVKYDWRTDMAGLKINRFTEANYLRLKYGDASQAMESPDTALMEVEDEERRVLYVAATRAKEELCFSYVPWAGRSDTGPGRSILNLMTEVLEMDLPGEECVRQEVSEPWLESVDAAREPATTSLGPVLEQWERVRSAQSRTARPQQISVSEESLSWKETPEESGILSAVSQGQMTGMLCHSVLETIDFANPVDYRERMQTARNRLASGFDPLTVEAAFQDGLQMLTAFFQTESAKWLASAEILGREVPVVLFDESDKIISGKIDLLVLHGEELYLIDYKTNQALSEDDLKTYARQMELYARAIAPSAGSRPLHKRLLLLRSGKFLEL